ncbi:hypothetical protein LNP25_23420 [Klebsiella variicola subsp. variicola]|nr:hypothetical protein [Klebsiella variicola subsp. variicola]
MAIAINYIDRTVLSAAAPHLIDELKLDPEMMGFIVAAFFGHIRYYRSPRVVRRSFWTEKGLGLAVAWWSIATSMMGVATGFQITSRLASGFRCWRGRRLPQQRRIAARWFPDKERATVSGLVRQRV